MRARSSASCSGTPPRPRTALKFAHIACDTSHGPRPVPPASSVVRCSSRCSASLSNSVVNAISSRDSSVGRGRSSVVTTPRYVASPAAS